MGTTYYHWDPIDDCVTHESDGAGNTIVTYDRKPGQFGPLISETRNGTTYTHHYDALGSTTALTDDTGAVTDTFSFDAGGNAVSRSGATPSPYQWVARLGYQRNARGAAYYARARSYSADLSRWGSVDPIWGLLGGLSQYVYANNSPTLRLDPAGLDALCLTSFCTKDCTLGEVFSVRQTSDAELQDRLNSFPELYRVEVVGKSREKFLVQHFTNNGAPAISM